MESFSFTPKDLEYFKSRGFQVYKRDNGKFYLEPSIIPTSARWEEAMVNARIVGIELSPNMEILSYTKKW